jgi:hypothetical protein
LRDGPEAKRSYERYNALANLTSALPTPDSSTVSGGKTDRGSGSWTRMYPCHILVFMVILEP